MGVSTTVCVVIGRDLLGKIDNSVEENASRNEWIREACRQRLRREEIENAQMKAAFHLVGNLDKEAS